jgi:predicted dehydrogenase
MAEAAADAGVILSVFHNRRWDADIRTPGKVVAEARLGDLWRVHSRPDLVDHMVWLLGPVCAVNTHLDWVDLP